MRLLRSFGKRLRSLLLRGTAESELEEELRAHIERETEQRIERGMNPEAARREALLAFGEVENLKESCRDSRGWRPLEELRQDLRYGVRTLLRAPAFLLTAVLTLALGIGANTAIFSAVYAVLLKPLPYADSSRLVAIWMSPPAGSSSSPSGDQPPSAQRRRTGWEGNVEKGRNTPELAPADFVELRSQTSLFDVVVAADPYSYTFTGEGDPVTLKAFNVSRGFFDLAGVKPLRGRTFLPEEYSQQGRSQVVVLSHRAWVQHFGANPDISGKPFRLNGQSYTVVGVMPPEFQLPVGGYYTDVDLWAPNVEPGTMFAIRASAFWPTMARLAPGVTLERAQQELLAVSTRLAQQYPNTNRSRQFRLVPLRDHLVGTLRPVLLILLGAVGLLLLIGCANVAGLLLVRATGRRRELDLRAALGASPARVVRQLMVENLMLAITGTVLGIAAAYGLVPILLAMNPVSTPLFSSIAIDGTVLAYAGALAGLCVVLFGLGPAISFVRSRSARSLELGSRSVGDHRVARRARAVLVIGQIAISVTLLAGAGLLVRSLGNLLAVDPGFRTAKILSAQVTLFGAVRTDAQAQNLVNQVIERMTTLPGVRNAAAVSNLPLHETPVDYRGPVTVEGRPRLRGDTSTTALTTIVTTGYFEALGIALRDGRTFTAFDTAESERVAVISQGLARQFWPDRSPLGAKIALSYPVNGSATVIGIVEDVKHNRPDADAEPEAYVTLSQVPSRLMTFVLRADRDAAQLSGPLRTILREIIRGVPLGQIATIEYFRSESFRAERFSTFLLTALALLAILLASVGMFGVVSYAVAAQRGELALRMALGAGWKQIIGGVLREGLNLAVVGVVIGIGGALIATRLLSGMLFGITTTDPSTYAAIGLGTLSLALLACLIPARTALRVDPASVLRAE
jgi:putative ABC transport system permease protein